ncbi:PriCT-2 domain-containing protein [Gloeocapsa sp. PCC 73106]
MFAIDPDLEYCDWIRVLRACQEWGREDLAEMWSKGGIKYDAKGFDRT